MISVKNIHIPRSKENVIVSGCEIIAISLFLVCFFVIFSLGVEGTRQTDKQTVCVYNRKIVCKCFMS